MSSDPRIAVPPGIPGIVSLFAFRPETAGPLNMLAEQLLRGPSTLTSGERELIAAVVSNGNDCIFCQLSHAAAAAAHLGDEKLAHAVRTDWKNAAISDKMKALLAIAVQVRESGKAVTDEAFARARSLGASDLELHDTVLIAAAFCMFNRYVDGLRTLSPPDPAGYRDMGKMLAEQGYVRAGQQQR